MAGDREDDLTATPGGERRTALNAMALGIGALAVIAIVLLGILGMVPTVVHRGIVRPGRMIGA